MMNRDYKFTKKMDRLVESLAKIILAEVKGEFVLCGIYSGGIVLGEEMLKHFNKREISTKLYSVRLSKNDVYKVAESTLPKKMSVDTTVVFLDDAIWTGRTKDAAVNFFKEKYPGVDFKMASLLDCTGQADFSVY